MIDYLLKIKGQKTIIIKILCLLLLFFGINSYLAFTTDTFVTYKNGFGPTAVDMFARNGRPVIAFIYELHYLSGLSAVSFYYISSLLALVFLGIAIWIMQYLLASYGIKENIRMVLSFVSIANIFIIEYFLFIEKCGFMLAILFNILGVYFLAMYFAKRHKWHIVWATLTMVLAIFTYQGTVALFVILAIPFAYKYAKNIKEYIINIIVIGIIYIIPVILDMLAFKYLFTSTRIVENPNYISNLLNIPAKLMEIKTTMFEVMPKHCWAGILFIVFTVCMLSALGGKNKIFRIFHIMVICVAVGVFSTATIIQGSGWYAMRTIYPFASFIGVLALDLYLNFESNIDVFWGKVGKRIVMISLVVLMFIQYISFNKIYIDEYKLNILDENRCNYIGQVIEEYQENSGIKVNKIAFYKDASTKYPQYPRLYASCDALISSFNTDWSDLNSINYYLNADYKKTEQVEQYTEFFAGKDWDTLSNEQLIFEDDTLHLCVY